MKKVLLALLFVSLSVIPAEAAKWLATDRVAPVGEMIIKKNSLPPNVHFKVVSTEANNESALQTNIIQIDSTNLTHTGNDNEVAYILSRELGGIIYNKLAVKDKIKDSKMADAIGIDLMINAGYNPLAGIVVLIKNPLSIVEAVSGKPANSNRAEELYDYLAYNYPTKLKIGYNCKEYKSFLDYIEPRVQERNSNPKKMSSFKKAQAKLRAKREKQFSKYKHNNNMSEWNITYELLKSLTEPEDNN